jgi:chromosome condensin MukBEF ATPase and DNA-binding subunit MukB
MKTQSVAGRVLEVLITQGGKTPKQLNEILKVKGNSVYTALSQLRAKKYIARDEDGVYITQTQTSITPVVPVVPVVNARTKRDALTINKLQGQVEELNKWCLLWREKYDKLEKTKDLLNEKYLDSKAVIAYLEKKLEK